MPWRPRAHRPAPLRPRLPENRDSSTERGYGRRRWRKFAKAYLAENPFCQCGPECCPNGCFRPATDVDHTIPVSGPDDPRFFDPAAVKGLAHPCHSRKTAEDRKKGLTR